MVVPGVDMREVWNTANIPINYLAFNGSGSHGQRTSDEHTGTIDGTGAARCQMRNPDSVHDVRQGRRGFTVQGVTVRRAEWDGPWLWRVPYGSL